MQTKPAAEAVLQAGNNGYIVSKEIRKNNLEKSKRKRCESGVHPSNGLGERHNHNMQEWQRTALSR